MFRELCGEEALNNVILVTNMWEKVPAHFGEAREEQLAMGFFKPALDKGAQLARHNNTVQSAHDIIRRIMMNQPIALQIQRELVDEGKDIIATAAGEALRRELGEDIRYCRAEVEALQEMMGRLKWEDEWKRQELADESRMFQYRIDRMTVRLEGMGSNYSKKKRRVDEALREIQEQAGQELETHEQMKKLRTDLEDMASNHREEKERMEEAMRQERGRAEAAYKRLLDSFNAEREEMRQERERDEAAYRQQMDRNRQLKDGSHVKREAMKQKKERAEAAYKQLQDSFNTEREEMRQEKERVEAAYEQQMGNNRQLKDSFNAEREAMKLQINQLQRLLDQSQPAINPGLCVICQDKEANIAVVDCG